MRRSALTLVLSLPCLTSGCKTATDVAETSPTKQEEPVEATPPPAPVGPHVRIEIFDANGQPLAHVPVSARGSDDWKPRLDATTKATGTVEMDLHEPGYVEILVGGHTPPPKNCGFGQGDGLALGLWIDGATTVQIRKTDDVFELESPGLAWPVSETREHYLDLLGRLTPLATAEPSDPKAAAALVERQWSQIVAEPDPRLRKLLAIEYATCVAQITGPEHLLRVLELVPPKDRAWVAGAGYLPQALWTLGDGARTKELVAALGRHHRDPGLEARVLHWGLARAHERRDVESVARFYGQLASERFRHTNGFRDARKFNPDRALRVGGLLPPFSATKLGASGGRVTNAQLTGRAWVINVWSSWCRPCVEELDALPGLYQRLRADEVEVGFLSISTDDERAACEEALAGRDLPWTLAWAEEAEALRKDWGFAGVPLTVVIDRTGTVTGLWDQGTSMQVLEKAARAAASVPP